MYRHGYFVWRGASRVEHARWEATTRGTARDYLCTRGSTGECTVAIVRTGVVWSSLVCWLVILIGGFPEVVARSAPVSEAEAGSMYAQGHRRLGAIVPNRRSGWAGVSQCKERLRATSQSGSGASGGGFGISVGGGAG